MIGALVFFGFCAWILVVAWAKMVKANQEQEIYRARIIRARRTLRQEERRHQEVLEEAQRYRALMRQLEQEQAQREIEAFRKRDLRTIYREEER